MNQLQIKYFLTAARCLNFTEAAKQLFISQPALSHQILTIEKELNMQLFIRSKNKVRLTPAGLTLLEELPKYEAYYAEVLKKQGFPMKVLMACCVLDACRDKCWERFCRSGMHNFERRIQVLP